MVVGAAAAEDDAVDRHAVRVLPLGIDGRALHGGRGEAGVRMGGGAAAIRRPVLAGPVDEVRGRLAVVMPSHQTSPSSVRATLVKMVFAFIDSIAMRVGLVGGAGSDAEESGFRIDGVELAVLVRPEPGDVVADDGGLPTGVLIGLRRDEHGEVGLAAGGGEGGGEIGLVAVGRVRCRR